MNLALIVDALVEAGATPQMIAAAVRAHAQVEENVKAEKRAKDAERQRHHRMSREVTVTPCDTRDIPAPLCPPSSSPTPPTTTPLYPPTHPVVGSASADANDGWPKDCRDQFWADWPHKVGKPKAMESLDRVRRQGVPFEQVMAGVRRYVRDKPPDRPWLNPATFLNQARFDDQPAPVSTSVYRPEKPNDRKATFTAALDKFRGRTPVAAASDYLDAECEEVDTNLFRMGSRG